MFCMPQSLQLDWKQWWHRWKEKETKLFSYAWKNMLSHLNIQIISEHFRWSSATPMTISYQHVVVRTCRTRLSQMREKRQQQDVCIWWRAADMCLFFLWEAELRSFRFSMIQMVSGEMGWDTDKEYAGLQNLKKPNGTPVWFYSMLYCRNAWVEMHNDQTSWKYGRIIAQGAINSSSTSSTEPECGLICLGQDEF